MVDEQLLQQLVLVLFGGSAGSIVALLATLVAMAVSAGRGSGGRG